MQCVTLWLHLVATWQNAVPHFSSLYFSILQPVKTYGSPAGTFSCVLKEFLFLSQVSLKSPDVMLTLPIHIGNVSLDKKLRPSKKSAPPATAPSETPADSGPIPETSASATTPTLPPRPGPKPAPRLTPRSRMSSCHSPSAPPAEFPVGAEGGVVDGAYQNKRQSQLVSPNAFSYAPGMFFSQNQQNNNPEASSRGATAPYPTDNRASTVPGPLIMPPDYSTASYPHGQFIFTLYHSVHCNTFITFLKIHYCTNKYPGWG